MPLGAHVPVLHHAEHHSCAPSSCGVWSETPEPPGTSVRWPPPLQAELCLLLVCAQVLALPHGHSSPNPLQGVKEFKCEVCGREFTLQANMKRHMLIHTSVRPYQCHICFKTFVQKQTLKTHMIVHSPVKPFKCKVLSGVPGG